MTNKLILTAVFIVFFPSCANSSSVQEQFVFICSSYKEVMADTFKKSSIDKKYQTVYNKIMSGLSDKNIKEYYSTLRISDPNESYSIFQDIAKEYLKTNWECPAMEQFYLELAASENQPSQE